MVNWWMAFIKPNDNVHLHFMKILISKFLFEIACSASSSTNVDALKFRLIQYDKFYSGEQQEDAPDCLVMLIEIINKSSVPYCVSNDYNSTGVSLSEILFSFMLEKYIAILRCMWTEILLIWV